MSKVYKLQRIQKISADLDEVWNFFSDHKNLQAITPPDLGFQILSKQYAGAIYPGQVIEYNVSPLLGIPLYWMTEITHVKDKIYFVDEQRFGPYDMWHHQHHFKEAGGFVEMTDIVHYKLPFWFLGDIAHALFVKKNLEGIFDYRVKRVEELFLI